MRLILGNLRDAAHGALVNAVAARDAGVFVLNDHDAARNLKNALGARVDADSATDALIGLKHRMGHDSLLLSPKTA